jgi:hypothetical protein
MLLEGLGALRADQGRWREAQRLRDELRPLAFERDELQHVAPFLLLSARVETAAGHTDRALAELERLRDHARTTDEAILVGPGLALACALGAPWLDRLERAAAESPAPETAARGSPRQGGTSSRPPRAGPRSAGPTTAPVRCAAAGRRRRCRRPARSRSGSAPSMSARWPRLPCAAPACASPAARTPAPGRRRAG